MRLFHAVFGGATVPSELANTRPGRAARLARRSGEGVEETGCSPSAIFGRWHNEAHTHARMRRRRVCHL
jgi:hypothetical protein